MNMTRRAFCGSMVAGTAVAATSHTQLLGQGMPAEDSGSSLPKPTPQQLAWQDLELGLFIHFDMATYTGKMKPETPADANTYNPTKLNTDQWLETAKSMGAKYAVFVAKHCTGFMQWQSNAYPYGCKQTSWRGGKRDVVRDFIESCRKYDIKPGLYASTSSNAWWGIERGTMKWGNKKQEDYVKACEAMLTELWSNYGPLTEIWFDGGVLPPEKGGPDVAPLLKKLQPDAIAFNFSAPGGIRWIGNEEIKAKYPCWNTVKKLPAYGSGDPDGQIWCPAECDGQLPYIHQWMWIGDQWLGNTTFEHQLASLDGLMYKYYNSVGRGCNMLLNVPPNPTGLISEVVLPHYANFGKEVQRRFGKSVAETKGEGNTVELVLKKPAKIDHVIIMEDIVQGQRVREYEVEGLVPGNKWQKLCDGISIGHKRIQEFSRIEVAKIRFRATKAVAVPRIRCLAVFNTALGYWH